MLNILKNTINRVFASGVDSDASAFITATGLSGTTQKSAITTLVKDLKASGLWSKMKAVYPMVTDNRNLFSYSEDFTNAFWVKNNTSVTSNSVTAPNGTLTADTLIPSAGTNIDNPVVFVLMDTASQTRTFSFYAKSAGYNYTFARVGGATPVALALFDLSNGTVVQTQAPAISASIESVGNGWYRCQMTYPNNPLYAPCIGTCSSTYTISSTGITTTTNGTSGIYIWGAQLESASIASTYQLILTTPSAFMASQMKYNLKDARDLDAAFRLTWSGGWTYSATGATPNGTNAYADTKLNVLSTLSQNDTHLSYYSRTNIIASQVEISAYSTATGFGTYLNYNLNGVSYKAFNSIEAVRGNVYNPTTGILIGSRINSSTEKYYHRGVLIDTLNVVSQPLVNYNLFLGAYNSSGNPNLYSTKQVAFSTIGNGLTDTEAQLLNQIVEKYQVALSRGVQAAQSFYYNSAYSNEANTYLYSTQITGTTQVSAINTLINGLKANNLWSKMKAVYPFVTDKTLQSDMAAQMKFNLVNPQDSDAAFRLAFSGGWTYSTNGAQPNGTNGYADTKINPSIVFGNRLQSFSLYTPISNSAANVLAGLTNGADTTQFYNPIGQFNIQNVAFVKSTQMSNGLVLMTATANDVTAFEKGVKLGSWAGTTYNAININYYIGARNNNSTADFYANRQYSFATIGDGLTDAEAALLYQLIQAFQTTLSRQV